MGAHSALHDPANCGDANLCDCPCAINGHGDCPDAHCARIGWGCHFYCSKPGVGQ